MNPADFVRKWFDMNMIQLALSTNIDQNSWLLTNTVFQIHMEILQHLLHQNYDVIELLISYLMIPSSLLELDANYLFVNGQLFCL